MHIIRQLAMINTMKRAPSLMSLPHVWASPPVCCHRLITLRGFPVHKYKDDRWGLVATYWGFGLQIGRALITQNDYNKDRGIIEGSILNHVSEDTLVWKRTCIGMIVHVPQCEPAD